MLNSFDSCMAVATAMTIARVESPRWWPTAAMIAAFRTCSGWNFHEGEPVAGLVVGVVVEVRTVHEASCAAGGAGRLSQASPPATAVPRRRRPSTAGSHRLGRSHRLAVGTECPPRTYKSDLNYDARNEVDRQGFPRYLNIS